MKSKEMRITSVSCCCLCAGPHSAVTSPPQTCNRHAIGPPPCTSRISYQVSRSAHLYPVLPHIWEVNYFSFVAISLASKLSLRLWLVSNMPTSSKVPG